MVGIALPLSVPLSIRVGERLFCLIGAFVVFSSVYASSLTTSFPIFVLSYAIITGFLVGLLFMVPLNNSFKYFPNYRGVVSGIISTGFGLSSFIFSYVVLFIVNPNNIKPNETIDGTLFPEEIALNFPFSLKVLAVSFFVLLFLGGLLTLTPTDYELEVIKE